MDPRYRTQNLIQRRQDPVRQIAATWAFVWLFASVMVIGALLAPEPLRRWLSYPLVGAAIFAHFLLYLWLVGLAYRSRAPLMWIALMGHALSGALIGLTFVQSPRVLGLAILYPDVMLSIVSYALTGVAFLAYLRRDLDRQLKLRLLFLGLYWILAAAGLFFARGTIQSVLREVLSSDQDLYFWQIVAEWAARILLYSGLLIQFAGLSLRSLDRRPGTKDAIANSPS